MANYFAGRCREGKYQDRDALYINTKVGEKVILIGGGANNGSEKLIKGFTIGSVYISEANECSKVFIQECFDRTLSSGLRKLFFDINPKNPQHYFYTDILDVHQENNFKYKDYGYVWSHFTIADNNSITDEQLRERLRTYKRGSVWWVRDVEGRRSAAEGVVYDGFSTNNIYDKEGGPNWDLFYSSYYSIDYGTINPFACLHIVEQTIQGVTEWYVDDEYYYDSRKKNKQISDAEYADEMKKFIGDNKYRAIIIDPSAASFKAELRKRSLRGKETDETINANNEVNNGIRLVATMLQSGHLHINKRCENLIKEFSAYIWDEKAAERGVEKVVKANDHSCVVGSTLIDTDLGQVPIKDLVGTVGKVHCWDEKTCRPAISTYYDVCMTQRTAHVYDIEFANGKHVKATGNHPILTMRGWKPVNKLTTKDLVRSITGVCELIISITYAGRQDVYNMSVVQHHNYAVEDGLILHNCDALRYFCKTIVKSYKF